MITETCANCTHSETLSIQMKSDVSLVYSGSAIEPYELVYTDGWEGVRKTEEDFVYLNNSSNSNVNAGMTQVTLAPGVSGTGFNSTQYLVFEIEKATASITATMADYAWDETAPTPVVTPSGYVAGNELTYSYKYKVKGANDALYATTVPTDIGEYTVQVTATTANYEDAVTTADFSVIPSSNGKGSVSIDGWTYGQTAATPSVTSTTNDTTNVTYAYKVKGADDSTYTSTAPTDAGEYTIRATIGETDDYFAIDVTADFTVAKADGIVSSVRMGSAEYGSVTADKIKEEIDAQSSTNEGAEITYEYKLSSEDDSAYTTTLPVNVGTYDVRVTFAATNNYNAATEVATFTITEKALTVTGVTATSREYNGTKIVEITGVTLDGVVDPDTVAVDVTGMTGEIASELPATYDKATIGALTTANLKNNGYGNYTLDFAGGEVATSVEIFQMGSAVFKSLISMEYFVNDISNGNTMPATILYGDTIKVVVTFDTTKGYAIPAGDLRLDIWNESGSSEDSSERVNFDEAGVATMEYIFRLDVGTHGLSLYKAPDEISTIASTAIVEFTVDRKPVGFTFENDSQTYDGNLKELTITPSVGEMGTDFSITYYQINENDGTVGAEVKRTVAMGRYLAIVELVNKNYAYDGNSYTYTSGGAMPDETAYANIAYLQVAATDVETMNRIIDEKTAELQAAIDEKAPAADLEKAITDLNAAIDAAKEAAISDAADKDAALKEELEGKITTAQGTLQAAIDDVNERLDQAVSDLEELIATEDGKLSQDLADAVTELKGLIDAAKQFATDSDKDLQAAIEAADGVLMTAINAVQENLDQAIEDLSKTISDVDSALSNRMTEEVKALNEAIDLAEKAAATANDELKDLLEGKLAEAQGTLQDAIDLVQDNLDKAVETLNQTISDNNTALSDRMTDEVKALNEAIDLAEKTAAAANDELKASLEKKLSSAEKTLQAAVDKVQDNLDKAVEELNEIIASGDEALAADLADAIENLNAAIDLAEKVAAESDEALEEKLTAAQATLEKELKALIQANDQAIKDAREEAKKNDILPIVLGSVGIAGNLTIALVWVILKKRKVK